MPKRKVRSSDLQTVIAALAYAIESIDMLPESWQQATDKAEMILLLGRIAPNAETLRLLARARLEQRRVELTDGYLELADPA